MSTQAILVDEGGAGSRLDVHVAQVLADQISRSQIQKMIRDGSIRVQGRQVSAHYKVKRGDRIEIERLEVISEDTRAEEIPLDIIAEDEDVILVNKPPGMVVHPAHANPHHTLVNALLYYVRNLSSLGGSARPGIVHRLDKDTSGIMIVAKNDRAHAILARQFKQQTVERVYRVIVKGVVQHDEGLCEEPVGRAFINRKKVVVKPSGGKEATTRYKVLKRYRDATLLEVRPQTGRTHQIRVHMRHMGHPVLGDELYGVTSPWIARQSVHALGLGFTHPTSRKKLYYETSLPEDMSRLLGHLEAGR